MASSDLRRETDPRRALLEHEHDVALELAERYLEMSKRAGSATEDAAGAAGLAVEQVSSRGNRGKRA